MSQLPSRAQLRAATEADRPALLDALARVASDPDNPAANDAAGELAWAVLEFRLARSAIRQYLFKESDVEAAEQMTLIAVAFRIGSFRSESKFTTWLYQVAKNEAKMMIRGERRHSDRADWGEPADHAEQFVARMSSMIADQNMVRAAIDKLGDQQKQALLLREEEALTYEEIADRLEIPLSTAKTWVRRARLALADSLADMITH